MINMAEVQEGGSNRGKKLCRGDEGGCGALDLDPELWKMLPEEVLEKAIHKLPFDSLVKFRAICKHWYKVIIPSAPAAASSGRSAILYFGSGKGPSWWLPLSTTASELTGPVKEFQPSSFPARRPNENLQLLASEAGLLFFAFVSQSKQRVCLSQPRQIVREIVVCNPLTSQSKNLGLPVALRPWECYVETHFQVGVVPDGQDGNYHVVVVGVDKIGNPRTFLYFSRIAKWAESNARIPGNTETLTFFTGKRIVSCNGSLYWYVSVGQRSFILKFDLQNDVWTRIRFWNGWCDRLQTCRQIAAYGGDVLVWHLHHLAEGRRIGSPWCSPWQHRSDALRAPEIKWMPQQLGRGIEEFVEKIVGPEETSMCIYLSFGLPNGLLHAMLQYSRLDHPYGLQFLRIVVHRTEDNSYSALPIVPETLLPANQDLDPVNVWSFCASLTAVP